MAPESGQLYPSTRFEDQASRLGARVVAGVDEAGRGPLAGPVVAAAVVLSRDEPIAGLNDSKLLTRENRERLFAEIQSNAIAVGVGIVQPETIDRINILQATRLAMTRAVLELRPSADYLLIDGPITLDLETPQQSIIKGDRQSLSVAGASIVAKVTRDRIMKDLHAQYPMYGFDKHKGYGTKAHKEAIQRHGPSPAHRLCFKGVKDRYKCPGGSLSRRSEGRPRR